MRVNIRRVEQWLADPVARRPDHPAVEAGGRALSYRELDSAAAATARVLAGRGVGARDRVATTLPPGLDFAVLLHALPRLGAALVPLNTHLTASERAWQVGDAGASVVIAALPAGEEAWGELLSKADPRSVHSVMYTSGPSGRPRAVEPSHD